MVSHHTVEFGDLRHCVKGDIISLVVEKQDSTCSCLNPSLQFVSKTHYMFSHTKFQNIDTPIFSFSTKNVRYWSHIFTVTKQKAFASPSKDAEEKKNRRKERQF